jgi:hypothetical protein
MKMNDSLTNFRRSDVTVADAGAHHAQPPGSSRWFETNVVVVEPVGCHE